MIFTKRVIFSGSEKYLSYKTVDPETLGAFQKLALLCFLCSSVMPHSLRKTPMAVDC